MLPNLFKKEMTSSGEILIENRKSAMPNKRIKYFRKP